MLYRAAVEFLRLFETNRICACQSGQLSPLAAVAALPNNNNGVTRWQSVATHCRGMATQFLGSDLWRLATRVAVCQ